MATADFTIADVLAWARTKPADESYNYSSNENCALCQFLRETCRARNPTVGDGWSDWAAGPYLGGKVATAEYPKELESPLMAGTFGTLVERLEKLCPETPVTPSNWLKIDAYMHDIEKVSA